MLSLKAAGRSISESWWLQNSCIPGRSTFLRFKSTVSNLESLKVSFNLAKISIAIKRRFSNYEVLAEICEEERITKSGIAHQSIFEIHEVGNAVIKDLRRDRKIAENTSTEDRTGQNAFQ